MMEIKMAKRKIITIDEDLCTGCGACITSCAEGALQLVDGKAKLVKELFCDGFGDCIGDCPTDALKIEERESDEFDVEATRNHVLETQGEEAVKRMDDAAERHEAKSDDTPAPPAGGCPGTRMRENLKNEAPKAAADSAGLPPKVNESELDQWPIQIHLVQPGAPFFKNKELVIMSTCAPIASADVHWRFIRGRGLVVGCPKLDNTGPYAEKLGEILKEPSIPRVLVIRMEVPCCGGLTAIAKEAVKLSGRTDLAAVEVTVSLSGEVISQEEIK
jgi:NAD-dependent dihydropyrimidine dehydrogenase PreA subunit